MFLKGNRWIRGEVNHTWQKREGPPGVKGCFDWDLPDDDDKPYPEPLEDGPDKSNGNFTDKGRRESPDVEYLSISPVNDEDKFGMKLTVKGDGEKKQVDRDHIYVGNQKIYRTCKTPDLYGQTDGNPTVKSVPQNNIEFKDNSLHQDRFTERRFFTDQNEKLKIQIKNKDVEPSNGNEMDETFDKLDITGERIGKNKYSSVRNQKEAPTDLTAKQAKRAARPLSGNITRPSSGGVRIESLKYKTGRNDSGGPSDVRKHIDIKPAGVRVPERTAANKSDRPKSGRRYKMQVPWGETEKAMRESVYL